MVMGEQTLETQVVVIGGGPGGYAAAFRAADLGLDVTLINAEARLGGVCLLRGCIPSKALLQAMHVVREARQAVAWGLTFSDLRMDLEALRTWKDGVIAQLANGLGALSQQRQVNLIQAQATFEASDRVRLYGADITHVRFEYAILATGSHPLPLSGVPFQAGSRIMDSTAALAVPDIPQTLLVVGGGYVGLELGSVYATLGSRVTLVEMTDGLLPGLDRDLVAPLAQRVARDFEALYFQTKVTQVEERDAGVQITLQGHGDAHQQCFDRIIVAIGRQPTTQAMGLEHTAVKLDTQGFVIVDAQQRTADPRIFAIGDVAGQPMLAHKAMYEGKIAAEVIAGEPSACDARCIPAVVYTDPEIAWCGLTETAARTQARAIRVGRFPWRASGRALTVGAADGLTKIIIDAETERVLGVGIVGRGAEDVIAEGAFAVEMGALAWDLALTIHPHPTLSETVAEATEAYLGRATHLVPPHQPG
jgi:dihydrolipoamide dehydrogenase